MSRKKNLIGLLLIFALVSSIIIINQINFAAAMEPSKLKISFGPTTIPADNNIYQCVFVELQDSNSKPARAVQDTTISLSSSLTTVGNVDPTVTINIGNTYAVANFNTTFTPGTTTIAATASGYATVQASLTTAAPVPSKLALYGFPPVLPSDGAPHDALVVQLQDASGNPAKAPLEGIVIALYSSNGTIVSVPASASIMGGQTYTLASLISYEPGSATITAMASGYTSTQTIITTQQPSTTQAKSLRIYVAPPKTLADRTIHSQLLVQLLNGTGKITQPAVPITIQLTSSNGNIGTVQPMLDIPAGSVYATATFSATYKAGSTTITAGAIDLSSDTETITTVGPIPSKLAVYCSPSVLPADNKVYSTIHVQLQDASGKPALDPNGDVTVSLFSSDPTVGTVPTTLTIPYGKTYATATFTSTYIPKAATITAQASGYTTGTATTQTYLIDQASMTIELTADPTTVVSGKQTNITAYVTDPGATPINSATVKFASSAGGTFATVKALENGYYTTIFTVPNFYTPTEVTITATVSKTDYATSTETIQITVISSAGTGTMQLYVKDDDGQPISDATVSSLLQPPGMKNLTDTTNSTGYVTFPNATEGNYTLNISKQGYTTMNQTLNFKANSTAPRTLFLTRTGTGNDQPSSDLTIVWLILGAVIVAVVVAVAAYMQKRKSAPKFKAPNKGAK